MPRGYFEQRRIDWLIVVVVGAICVGSLLGTIAFFR